MTFYIPPLVAFPNTLNIFDGSKKWYHEGKLIEKMVRLLYIHMVQKNGMLTDIVID